jgi:predicted PurR-regulated permease PerM
MPDTTLVNKSVLLIVVAGISALFLGIIGRFLEAIFLAGLFSAVCHPLYRWFLRHTGNRQALSSFATMILVLFFIIIPVVIIATIVIGQATDFATAAIPWIQNLANEPGIITGQLEKLPFYDRLLPFRDLLTERVGGVLVSISGTGVGLLQTATVGTFNALITGLLVLYSFFFFLMDGGKLIQLILYYLPLADKNEHLLLNRFRSVTIATLKGTAVIGFLQGGLAGIALSIAGVPNALFWSITMMLLSVVPGIGAALVWIPACLYLAASGKWAVAAGLFAFCGLLVGSIDNVLRPKLVGSDTQLHELMIFFSTLGGLLTFGMSGFIIGPIIAALFVTVWEIYGVEFRHWLPRTAFVPHGEEHAEHLPGEEDTYIPDVITEVAEQSEQAPEDDSSQTEHSSDKPV